MCIHVYMETTIRVSGEIKSGLDGFRQHKNESYNELIRKLLFVAKMCENEPRLSQKTVREIMEARKNIAKGDYYTEDEAKKILGV